MLAVPPMRVPLLVPLPIVTGPLVLPLPPSVPEFTCTAPVPVAEPVWFVTRSVPPLTAVPPVKVFAPLRVNVPLPVLDS